MLFCQTSPLANSPCQNLKEDGSASSSTPWTLPLSVYVYNTNIKPTEIIEFSERSDEFKAVVSTPTNSQGADVIGCSVDSKFSHLAWANMDRKAGGIGDMKIPLMADLNKSVSKDYGVLYEQDGIALRGIDYFNGALGTFIIDPAGVLRHSSINDTGVGRNIAKLSLINFILSYANRSFS
jgi:alkyl hydroperoxide reductase subunit AhpC